MNIHMKNNIKVIWIFTGFVSGVTYLHKRNNQIEREYKSYRNKEEHIYKFYKSIKYFITGPILLPVAICMTRYDNTGIPTHYNENSIEQRFYLFKKKVISF